MPTEFFPAGSPNSSPMATLTAGAIWATTRLSGAYSACHTSLRSFLIVIAAVGQTAAHWPQLTQSVSTISLPKAGLTTILAPRWAKSMAPTCCTSLHILTQSPHRIHLLGSLTMERDESSMQRSGCVLGNLTLVSRNLAASI